MKSTEKLYTVYDLFDAFLAGEKSGDGWRLWKDWPILRNANEPKRGMSAFKMWLNNFKRSKNV